MNQKVINASILAIGICLGANGEKIGKSFKRNLKTKLAKESERLSFDDFLDLDDNIIKQILERVDLRTLALALKGKNAIYKKRVVMNLDKSKGEELENIFKSIGPLKISDIVGATTEIETIINFVVS